MDAHVDINLYSEAGEEVEGLQYCYVEIPVEDGIGLEIDLKKLMTYPGSDKLTVMLRYKNVGE
jgi:RNase P/RNase MRP subunit p30